MKEEFKQEYAQIARDFIKKGDEADLYRASLLGRKLESDYGPHDVIQLHFEVLEDILRRNESDSHRNLVRESSALLIEVMMVFSAAQRKIRDILEELRYRYDELDQAKSELEKSRDELREKTAQLIQTEKMTALGELTAGVAHELNQPLNVIKIICEDIARDVQMDRLDIEMMTESIGDAIGEVKRMAEIVDHMRIFTRKTEGTQRDRVSAASLVNGVFKLLGQQLVVHGIEVTREDDPQLQVLVDGVRMEQVIMNLIANARDAVRDCPREDGCKISVKTYLEREPDIEEAFVIFEVADNGIGIPEDLTEKIFEPFYTRKPPGQGTGLGLSLCQQIVKDHGGHISVKTKLNEGTTFKVHLPAFPAFVSSPPLRNW